MLSKWQPGVVILAAGASARMGRPKLLLPWGGTTVLGRLVGTWRESGVEQLAVVMAEAGSPLEAELDRLGIPRAWRIANPDPSRGMFSSIQCAAAWAGWERPVSHVALTLGDQPLVRRETLTGLLAFSREFPGAICQPARGGRPRHPVIFPTHDWAELKASEDESLRQFLEARGSRRLLFECDDPGLDLDLDEPTDYQRALEEWGRGGKD